MKDQSPSQRIKGPTAKDAPTVKVSEGRYPVHVVVGVSFAPPLAGVAAVAAILVLKVTNQKDQWTPERC